jgi:hypothetical protein
MEICPATGADPLDGLPPGRSTALVRLLGLFQWTSLRAPIGHPLWRWRTAVLRLALPSQQETPMYRGVNRAQKTRMRLGGSPDLLQPFPKRPRGMHRGTYMRLQARDPFAP